MGNNLKIRERLPIHSGEPGSSSIQALVLRVDGLVRNPLMLTRGDLEKLPQQDLTHDFTCLEGWTVPEVKWRGVALNTVLSMAEPHPEARYVQASAGEFSIALRLDSAVHVLLAIYLGETSVPPEHGGPVRLVVPGGDCFMNIKWLDHLELCREPGPNTAKTIALGRLPSPEDHGS
ncbi:MAG TPA: molybdopterin-dependent oxidoreductase [Verrucomicrobiae bacterium]|nr:molybdopterin-dependent oxidoreductase [Verrucomicrobiae bacterium]